MQKILTVLVWFFIIFSFVPTLYEIKNRNNLQPDRAFELVHNFPTDYNFYLSRIREGLEGRLTVVERYTSEPHNGSYIHILYLFLGWVGRFTRVPWHRSSDIYHVARFVFGITLLFFTAHFAGQSFSFLSDTRSKKIWLSLAFLLAVTASTWPKLVFFNGGWRLGGYMPWWSLMDSLQRIAFIPHLLVGQALIVFLIATLWDEATMKKGGNWLFLGALAFVLGMVFPPGLLFVAVTVVCMGIANLGPRGLVIAMGAPALLYLQLMTSFYPWKRLAQQDILNPLPFQYMEYFLAVGYVFPFGILGGVFALIRREKYLIPAVSWVVAWLSLLAIFRFVPQQSPLRFSEMLPHVPLGILTAYLFYMIWHWFGARLSLKSYQGLALIPPLILVVIGLGVMYSSWLWQRDFVDHKMRSTYPFVPTGSYVLYPLKDFIHAVGFIQDSTSTNGVILAGTTAGNYIPPYTGRTVYIGHANTVRAEEKQVIVSGFFRGAMKPDEAKAFLTDNRISAIFFGPQEREESGTQDLGKLYPFLRVSYKNTFVTVYTIAQ
ncbi:hypothetical protein A2971_02260 [Candidatus Gottesmanbacteria bacterium RIFCSPLOWO2_01_FULL_46_21]|uniref:Glycosyltransferase RgtA/B/C/D-like domain-containing protein n=1 Tax=Candidatus Gottesmanbacteria bacterium RIFCSPLOWO2_01_FULL_46_21 TaxID=1798393 RepID=A0A1F6AY81_9BACT|nr:MAG: hypothetical protein A2971_02260 [Candidatus Gottesmanbacteria bacterium RIFCSPLOWO2_01_FULL_46_21]